MAVRTLDGMVKLALLPVIITASDRPTRVAGAMGIVVNRFYTLYVFPKLT